MRDLSYGQIDPKFAALKAELRRSERILWQSSQNPQSYKSAMAVWGFAVLWTAFACFWTTAAWFMTRAGNQPLDGMAYLFPLFGVPFILVGLYMLVRPFLSRTAAKRTVFAVTNERVIKLLKGKGVIVESVSIDRIGSLFRVDGEQERGTLQINLTGKAAQDGEPAGNHFFLRDVDNVKAAESRIREMLERAKHPSAV
ncbi:MAG: hypothetical protein WAT93_01415 [Pontixanthobacter sp.]